MRVIGLMSGTSLDGVDAALIETDGERVEEFGHALTVPYTPGLRDALRRLIELARSASEQDIAPIEVELTRVHAEAVARIAANADLIGLHGQTILHDPAHGITRQIGDAALLARLTGLPIACDFRLADVAAGGQGAPLVPVFHAALARGLALPLPALPLWVVNIGGVANVTYIGANGALVACDTGPGNALLDDWMLGRTGAAMDVGGAMSLAGVPDEAVLSEILGWPFFAQPAPKSLDRQHFAAVLGRIAQLSTADGAATLTALTARAIARAKLPSLPARVLVCGGGRHNPAIMGALAQAMTVPVEPVEAVGWDGDALEAQCFGFLAARVARGLPLSFPNTTGVPHAMPGGRIVTEHGPIASRAEGHASDWNR